METVISDLPILNQEQFKDFYDVDFSKMEPISMRFYHIRIGYNKVDNYSYILKYIVKESKLT